MKKILTGATIITICAVLCYGLWTHNDQPHGAPVEAQTPTVSVETVAVPATAVSIQKTPEGNIAPVSKVGQPLS